MTRPNHGSVETVAPGVRRIIAPNPGPMTYWGTNTYVVGTKDIAIIDPGPDIESHLDAILTASEGGRIVEILVTHAHADHTALVPRLKTETGACASAFGTAESGRSDVMKRLANDGLAQGGEGVDHQFRPDNVIKDGSRVECAEWKIDAIHTPGHFAGHLSFRMGDVLFSGDHIMDWSTTIISPPDGDLTAFMSSTRRLQTLDLKRLLPGHGHPIDMPEQRLEELLRHRISREEQILNTLSDEGMTLAEVTEAVYTDIDPKLLPAAARNTLAHLIDLVERKRVTAHPRLAENACFSRL